MAYHEFLLNTVAYESFLKYLCAKSKHVKKTVKTINEDVITSFK